MELPDPPWGSAVRVRSEGAPHIVSWPRSAPLGRRLLQALFLLGLIGIFGAFLQDARPLLRWAAAGGSVVACLPHFLRTRRPVWLAFPAFALLWAALPGPWGNALLAAGCVLEALRELKRLFLPSPRPPEGEARLVLAPEVLEWETVRIPRAELRKAEARAASVVLDGGPELDGALTPVDAAWLAEAVEAWAARPLPALPAPSPGLRLQLEDTSDRLEAAWRVPAGGLRRGLRAAGVLFLMLAVPITAILFVRSPGRPWLGWAAGTWVMVVELAWLPNLKRLASGQGEARLLLREGRLRWDAGGGLPPVLCRREDLREGSAGLERRAGARWLPLGIRHPGAEETRWLDELLRAWVKA